MIDFNEPWTRYTKQNVFEMYVAHGGPGFWVRRLTWDNTCARIIRVGKFTRAAPYYGSPSVLMDVYTLSGMLKEELAQLPVPGTYKTWRLYPEPEWAATIALRPLDDPEADAALLQLNKKRGKAYKDYSGVEKCWLKVSYDRKEEAKALGARWSQDDKKWWLAADAHDAIEKARAKGFVEDAKD